MTIPLRILIVEDSADDAEVTMLELSRGGPAPDWRRVDTADGMRSALAEGPWDVVLSDFTMPGFGAAQALALCREADPDTPFLVVSGTIGEQRAVEMMRAGAADYLLKGNLTRLAAAVEREVREGGNRRANRAAEWQTRQLAAIVSDTDHAIISQTLGGVITTWNAGAERLYGYTAGEAIGRHASFLVESDREEELRATREIVGRGDSVPAFDTVRLHKSGTRLDVSVGLSPVRDSEGWVVGMSGIGTDISVRKRSEEAVRASEARFRAVVEKSYDGVVLLDAGGTVLYASPSAGRIGGRPPEEYVGRKIYEFKHPDEVRTHAAGLQDLARWPGGGFTGEGRFLHADGSWRRVESTFTNLLHDPDVGAVVVNFRDVTDQKLAAEAVRQSQQRLRDLIDGLGPSMFVGLLTPEGILIDVNRPPLIAAGLEPEDVLGKPFSETHWWAHSPDAQRQLREAIVRGARGEPSRYDVRVRGADDQIIDIDFSLQPLRNETGEVAFLIPSAAVITDRKRAEVERDELLARLQLQIERMPLAYLLTGPDFRYTVWNPAAERAFGFTRAEALGKHPFEIIVPPQAQPLVAGVFDRLAAGDLNAHGVCENLTKDGRTIVCEWHNTPLFGSDGIFAGVLSLAQDITDRRQAQEELRLRDRAIQAVTQGILITDPSLPDNPIIFASPGFLQMTGYAAEEVVGRNWRFLQGKDTDPATVAQIREAVEQGQNRSVEILNYRKDGTPFWNALAISPVHDGEGRPTHFVGVQADVTERRYLEDQYRQSQKMEVVGQLAGGIAHDFNNLLCVINGYGELLLTRLPKCDPAREMIREMTKAGERAAGLTRQLLAFSRKTVLTPEILDFNAVVIDMEKLLRRTIGEDIDLGVILQPGLGRVKADPGQVEQVLMNLCVNARDAMPKGGKMTIETRDIELDAAYAGAHAEARPGCHVLLAVSDTGHGMTEEVKSRIFEPFFTTKEKGRGTGLGLATVFGIVKQSGGSVEVYSEPGLGTSFKVYLPRVENVAPSRKSSPALPPVRRGTETVLLVEDEDAVRALTRIVLTGSGYAILEARSGEEGLRVAARHQGPIQLLISDVVMPELGGPEMAGRLVVLRPEMKVLFLSGYTDDAIVRHGILQEKVNFLQKPFSTTALAQKVREVLDAGS
jgi:PAS domain S-box-containing protein